MQVTCLVVVHVRQHSVVEIAPQCQHAMHGVSQDKCRSIDSSQTHRPVQQLATLGQHCCPQKTGRLQHDTRGAFEVSSTISYPPDMHTGEAIGMFGGTLRARSRMRCRTV